MAFLTEAEPERGTANPILPRVMVNVGLSGNQGCFDIRDRREAGGLLSDPAPWEIAAELHYGAFPSRAPLLGDRMFAVLYQNGRSLAPRAG